MKRVFTLVTLAALVALPATAQVDFSRYCALGDSLTAGVASAGISQFYQERAYPAMLAHQGNAGVFEQALVSEPGLPPLLELVSLDGPVIAAPQVPPGSPINTTYPAPYNNLGVSGSNLYDLMFTTGNLCNLAPCNPACGPPEPCNLTPDFSNAEHDIVLRDGTFTALEQCIGLSPTFVTMFIGNNDALGAALVATPIEGVTLTPLETFAQLYPQALGALVTNTAADIVVMTLPYPTAIPFVTTVSPFLDIPGLGQVPIMGSNGPLTADDYVTLAAGAMLRQGFGVPGGPPLPEDLDLTTGAPGFVLRAAEVEMINGRIDGFNQVIRDTAAALGVHVFDVNGWFNDVVAGEVHSFGGWEPSADFLTGGIFSYDGVHPQNVGHAIVTLDLIDFINHEMNGNLPQLNMEQILCSGGCAGQTPEHFDAKNVTFSEDAFQQLLDIFVPDLRVRAVSAEPQLLN